MADNSTDFLIGELSGQVHALITQNTSILSMLTSMDARLRENEKTTNSLTVKMSLLGAFSGGVGSLTVSFLGTLFEKFAK